MIGAASLQPELSSRSPQPTLGSRDVCISMATLPPGPGSGLCCSDGGFASTLSPLPPSAPYHTLPSMLPTPSLRVCSEDRLRHMHVRVGLVKGMALRPFLYIACARCFQK